MILIALLVLSFLVFFHELGHYVVARMCGVRVEVFSIGFGKKLITKRIGQTQYALSLIPLGGYVKLKGQDDTQPLESLKPSLESDSYRSKTPMQRIAILLAGPAFNLILAFMLYVAVGIGGKPSLLPIVGEVKPEMPAFEAGIKPNDRIVSINGAKIRTWEELDSAIVNAKDTLKIEIERDTQNLGMQNLEVSLTPIISQAQNVFGEPIYRNLIGITSQRAVGIVHYQGLESLSFGLNETLKASTLIAQGIIKLISGAVPSSEVGGVVSIVSIIGKASQEGWVRFFIFVALISVNLGILNLLPIPALDGGHILFNCYEMIAKKPPNEQIAYYLTFVGWGILLFLMLLGLYNDIARIAQ
uniref:Zinc metalloprotease n=1 Tax=uncultured Helicobacter sp. TaxID=175537 RepID=A0A650EL85_9HELI|nr:putative zinc metalloprotease [uncultured Helicobacter sp.]